MQLLLKVEINCITQVEVLGNRTYVQEHAHHPEYPAYDWAPCTEESLSDGLAVRASDLSLISVNDICLLNCRMS